MTVIRLCRGCPRQLARTTEGDYCHYCRSTNAEVYRQQKIERLLDAIDSYEFAHRRSPTVRELMARLGFRSESSVMQLIGAAVMQGRLQRHPKKARTLRVVKAACPTCGRA